MRLASLLLAIGVSIGAGVTIRTPQQAPDALGFAALNQTPPEPEKAVALYQRALSQDGSNPYRWSDLGFAYQSAGDVSDARRCYRRALELSGSLPAIWLRDANFHFTLGEPDAALQSAARVLETVPDYDEVLFGYFGRFNIPVKSVLAQIGQDRRATQAYIRHLIEDSRPDEASLVWRYALPKGFVDPPLANLYVDAMLRAQRYADAQGDWVKYLGEPSGDYPTRNRLFNGGFEMEPTGSALDWRISPSPDVDTLRDSANAHDGKWALLVRFHGAGNVSYNDVLQMVPVAPGRYKLQAWVRSDQITTNECPRIEVFDAVNPARLDVSTDPFCGTTAWRLADLVFAASPATKLIGVRIARRPSQKFDNKINGSLWIDSVRLTGE